MQVSNAMFNDMFVGSPAHVVHAPMLHGLVMLAWPGQRSALVDKQGVWCCSRPLQLAPSRVRMGGRRQGLIVTLIVTLISPILLSTWLMPADSCAASPCLKAAHCTRAAMHNEVHVHACTAACCKPNTFLATLHTGN